MSIAFGLAAGWRIVRGDAAAIRAIPATSQTARESFLAALVSLPFYGLPEPGAPMHDPCTIAWLLRPELFELVPVYLGVETDSPLTLGATAVEFRLEAGRPTATRWATRVDAEGVFALLKERLR